MSSARRRQFFAHRRDEDDAPRLPALTRQSRAEQFLSARALRMETLGFMLASRRTLVDRRPVAKVRGKSRPRALAEVLIRLRPSNNRTAS